MGTGTGSVPHPCKGHLGLGPEPALGSDSAQLGWQQLLLFLQPGASLIPSLQVPPGSSQVTPNPGSFCWGKTSTLKPSDPSCAVTPWARGDTVRPTQHRVCEGCPGWSCTQRPFRHRFYRLHPGTGGETLKSMSLVEQHPQGVGEEVGGGSRSQVSEDWGCRHPWCHTAIEDRQGHKDDVCCARGVAVSLLPPVHPHSLHTVSDNAFFPRSAEDLLQQHHQGNPQCHPWSRWDLLQPSPLI